MNNLYDLHSYSKQYRQKVLHEARMKQLEGWLREKHKARSVRGSVSLALTNVLSLVRERSSRIGSTPERKDAK